ncbi:Rho GTPase activation protein [Lactarius hengduanensis]|nr:Rho GTPase activation protein [Lactarius hengduanensis]
MDGLTTAYTTHGKQAMSTSAEVETALAGTDTSDLRASFGHALSYSIPPLTLYCNYRPNAYSNLIFGVPLVNLTTNRDNVPKVIRMCIEEVEKRGLDTHKIYSLRRRFESEKTFSFGSTDDIHSVAMLLRLYLRDLPEPLYTLSLEDCRQYRKNRARYIENDCSLLRSKIRELHPIHWASLEALLLHLFRVSSHSDKNAMTVEALAAQFCYTVFRGNAILEGGVHAKQLVMEDFIQNSPILFNERPSPPATEWWLPHPRLHQHPEASTIPPSRPESVLSSASDFSLCAASSISGAEPPPSPAASTLSVTTDSLPSPAASLLFPMGTSSSTRSERI